MKASYKKSWELLADKGDLHKATGLSSSTMIKFKRNENVTE